MLKLLGSFKPEKLQKYIDMIEISREKLNVLDDESLLIPSSARRPPHKHLDIFLKA